MIEDIRVVVEKGPDGEETEGILYYKPTGLGGRPHGKVRIEYLILGKWYPANVVVEE